MAKRKKADNKALIKSVEEGTVQTEIMDKYGFKNSTQLKVAYVNALMDTGHAPAIKSGRKSATAKAVSKEVAVGKRGSLIVSKAQIADLGFQEGDTFVVRKTKAGLSLSRTYKK